ncbi:hypothetical protein CY35_09G095500 [Sphagnum magellanicum]|nr:hypothetical protein CY35_09G095500 [Sphagnum magellanicum]
MKAAGASTEVQGNCVLPNNSVASCSLEEEDGENHHHTIRGNISTETGVEYWSLWGCTRYDCLEVCHML